MRTIYGFAGGLGVGLIISACATGSFPYTVYGLDLKDQKLLASASSGAKDEPLTTCDATDASASPCVVFLTPEYITLKTNYLEMEAALIACQKSSK